MALDLRKNIEQLIENPIGKKDAEALKEMLGALKQRAIANNIVEYLIDEGKVENDINRTVSALESFINGITEKLERLEKENSAEEYAPTERDSSLLDEINDKSEENNAQKYREKEKGKSYHAY